MSDKITIDHQGETFSFDRADMETRAWDAADYLQDEESVALYLSMIAEEGNSDLLIKAIGDVIRGLGMRDIADKTNMARSTLYQQFSGAGNPTLRKLLPVLDALGLEMQFVAKRPDKTEPAH